MSRWTDEQLDAINKEGTNIIVSAGAGSGKTAVLTERVIRKLKSDTNINELLILTFTNAAAAEMKDRIRKKVIKENLNNQLSLIDQAFITTFDAYALYLVKKYSYILNLSKNISIIDDSVISIKKENILTEIFEEYYSKNDNNFSKLISDFCVKDDTELKKGLLNINNKLTMKYGYQEYIKEYIDNNYKDEIINIKIEEYINLLKEKKEEIKEYLKIITDIENIDYVNKLYKVINPLLESEEYIDIKNTSTITLPSLKKESDAYPYKEMLNKKIKELNELCSYDNILDMKNMYINTKEYVKIICEILEKFNNRLFQYKKTINMYEFNDIAHLAIKLVKENKSIRDEQINSFKEILLDEYQDTNDLQEEFINLISKNNVYCVGDIKQSIYRFRNANPLLFKSKYDNYKLNKNGLKIDLNKNFRSRHEPLDDINLIFNDLMKDEVGGANYKLEHQMIFGNNTYINEGNTSQDYNLDIYEYESKDYTKTEMEAFIIANDILNKVKNNYKIFDKDTLELRCIRYEDCVILMDRKKDFDLYKKIFEFLNIPLTLYKEENINNGYDLDIFTNVLKLLLYINQNRYDEEFKHSFISIERSYLIKNTDEEIFKYFINNNYHESDLIKTLKEIDINNISIREIIEDVIKKFDIYSHLITKGDINESKVRIEYILNLASNLEKENKLEEFIDYLDKVEKNKYDIKYSINMESENSVKMMTIFKSKGLEFNICYFPGLYNEFNKQEFKERFFFDKDYGIIVPCIKEGICDTFYKTLFKNKYTKEEISEKIRLFYVALTRAKEKIILLKPKDVKIKENILESKSFLDMISSFDKLDDRKISIDIEKLNISKKYNLIKQLNFSDYIKDNSYIITTDDTVYVKKIEETKNYSKKSGLIDKNIKDKMEFGIKMHEILENIDFKNPNLDNIDNPYIKNKIQKFIENDIFKNVINCYQEYEFMYENETINHGIIDLMLEYEDEIKIIDYKLKNIDDINYIKQIEGYREYISSITNKRVTTYLYSFIDEKLQKST